MTWAVREKGYSQRRACGLVGLHPKTYRYAPKRSGDEELRRRLRELASQRRRFGYRRLGLMLKRQGIELNRKKLYRLYKEERLTVRKRGGRKRALGTRAPMAIPQDRNLRWSLDFVADTLASGRRFRILTLVDDFTRECLGLVVDTSLTGLRVARELDRIAELRGYPCMIVSDNGTELTSNAILAWQQQRSVEWRYTHRVNPCRMALSKASTAVCGMSASTSICLLLSRTRMRPSRMEVDYNTNRPHSSLDGLTRNDSQHAPIRGKTETKTIMNEGKLGSTSFPLPSVQKGFHHYIGNAVCQPQAAASLLSRRHRDLLQRGQGKVRAGTLARSECLLQVRFCSAAQTPRGDGGGTERPRHRRRGQSSGSG